MDVDVSMLLTLLVFVILAIVFTVILGVFAISTPEAVLIRDEKEKCFKDPNASGAKKPFGNLDEPGNVDLSVIVPAYEEEERLPKMLDECLGYLEKRRKSNPPFSYEVIIVDDGSKDRTSQVGLLYSKDYGTDQVRVMTLVRNRGKGGAVKLGFYGSRGKFILFADADGATKFADVEKLEASMERFATKPEEDQAIVVGSRAHLEKDSIAQRSLFRTILMYGFHFLVWFFCVREVRDTQCGFKLLTRSAARTCFSNLHLERWAFDVELLYIAQHMKMKIAEVAVNWTEIDGSKVTPFWSWLQMGKDLTLIWLRYKLGAWRIKDKTKSD